MEGMYPYDVPDIDEATIESCRIQGSILPPTPISTTVTEIPLFTTSPEPQNMLPPTPPSRSINVAEEDLIVGAHGTCRNCRWWGAMDIPGTELRGDCALIRPSGPRAVIKASILGSPSGWVSTHPDFFCAEWMRKEPQAKTKTREITL